MEEEARDHVTFAAAGGAQPRAGRRSRRAAALARRRAAAAPPPPLPPPAPPAVAGPAAAAGPPRFEFDAAVAASYARYAGQSAPARPARRAAGAAPGGAPPQRALERLDADPVAAAGLTRFVYDARLRRLVEEPAAPPARAPREGGAARLARAAEPFMRFVAAAFEICEEGMAAAGWDDSGELTSSLAGEPHWRTAAVVLAALFLWHHGLALLAALVGTAALFLANGLAARRARGDAAGAPPVAVAALAALLALLAAAARRCAGRRRRARALGLLARARAATGRGRLGRRARRAPRQPRRAPALRLGQTGRARGRARLRLRRAAAPRGGARRRRGRGRRLALAPAGALDAPLPRVVCRRAGLPRGVAYLVCGVYSFGKAATLLGRLLPEARAAAARRAAGGAVGAPATRAQLAAAAERCPICLEFLHLAPGGARALACNHVFCGGCLDAWIERSASCPVCRARVAAPRAACGCGDPTCARNRAPETAADEGATALIPLIM